MIKRPEGMSALEFTVLAALRSAQLARGCVPRVTPGHTICVTAQREVAAGRVVRQAPSIEPPPEE